MSKFFEAARRLDPGLLETMLPPPAVPAGTPPAATAARPLPGARTAIIRETDPVPYAREFSVAANTSPIVLPFHSGTQEVGEEYRLLRTRILQHPRAPRVLCVTSPGAGDGKSVTALNLAGALALKQGTRVLLLDCDFRRPSLAARISVPPEGAGVAEVLSGEIAWRGAIQRCVELPNLYLATAGRTQAHSAELLDSRPWSDGCEYLRSIFHFIVIDSPPAGLVADFELIQAVSDGVLIVARVNHSTKESLKVALETIDPERNLGLVLNGVERWFLWKPPQQYASVYRGHCP